MDTQPNRAIFTYFTHMNERRWRKRHSIAHRSLKWSKIGLSLSVCKVPVWMYLTRYLSQQIECLMKGSRRCSLAEQHWSVTLYPITDKWFQWWAAVISQFGLTVVSSQIHQILFSNPFLTDSLLKKNQDMHIAHGSTVKSASVIFTNRVGVFWGVNHLRFEDLCSDKKKQMTWQILLQNFWPDFLQHHIILIWIAMLGYQLHSCLYSPGFPSTVFAPSYVAPFI